MRHPGSYPRRYHTLSTTKVISMPPFCVEQALETRTVQCVNTGHLLKRMKGLKKLKRKMGLAPRWAETVTRSELPLLFHDVCGENTRVTHQGKVVRRTQSFCKGIAFSNRPINLNEKVRLRLLEVSSNWSGVVRFGFTSVNPESLRGALPKYVCPDLTSRTGYWAKALGERFGKQGSVLHFSYNSAGDVVYGIDDVDAGIFLKGVDTRVPLWIVLDVYGNSTSLQFVDPADLLNNRPAEEQAPVQLIRKTNYALSNRTTPAQPKKPYKSSDKPEQVVSIPGFGNLSISDPTVIRAIEYDESSNILPLVIHKHVTFEPMSFTRTKGLNIKFTDCNRTVATRNQSEYSKGYVFAGRALAPNKKIVIQVLAIQSHYVGAMSFGVTSADPRALKTEDLPEDCDELLDRPEYWVVCKDVAASPKVGDELSFTYNPNGQITFAKNNGTPHVIMHVDSSLELYAFFDLFGTTSKIRMLGSVSVVNPSRSMDNEHARLRTRINLAYNEEYNRHEIGEQRRINAPYSPDTTPPPQDDAKGIMQRRKSPGTVSPTSNNSSVNGSPSTWSFNSNNPPQEASDCSICYERQIDSVLYSCGHMCMCFQCAQQQWKGNGACPICRAVIKDVIRTYKS